LSASPRNVKRETLVEANVNRAPLTACFQFTITAVGAHSLRSTGAMKRNRPSGATLPSLGENDNSKSRRGSVT